MSAVDITLNGIQTKKFTDLTENNDISFEDGMILYKNGMKSATLREIFDAVTAHMKRQVGVVKDITDAWYDGTLKAEVRNSNFKNVEPINYIIGRSTGMRYIVLDLNYFINSGASILETPHLVIMNATPFGNYKMNDTNTTAGGLKASKMYTETIPALQAQYFEADFGDDLIAFDNLITNAIDSNGHASGFEWRGKTRKCDLLSEISATGSQHWGNGYDSTIQKEQFAAFAIAGISAILGRQSVWFGDIASATLFSLWYVSGFVGHYGASYSCAAFLFALIG